MSKSVAAEKLTLNKDKMIGLESPKKTAEVQHNPPLKGDTTQIHENKFICLA